MAKMGDMKKKVRKTPEKHASQSGAQLSLSLLSTALKRSTLSSLSMRYGLLVVAVSMLVLSLPFFKSATESLFSNYPISSVEVHGTFNYLNEEKLRKALEKYVTANYFEVELTRIKNAAEALPWVETAWVKKEWPNTVVLKIQERVAVANWGRNQLISHKHEIFRSDDVQHIASLPTFFGTAEHASQMMERYQALSDVMQPVSLAITELFLEDRLSWRIKLADGVILVVDEKDCLAKLERFVELYQKMPESDRTFIEQVDLRYDNGLAIKWKKKDGESNAA